MMTDVERLALIVQHLEAMVVETEGLQRLTREAHVAAGGAGGLSDCLASAHGMLERALGEARYLRGRAP